MYSTQYTVTEKAPDFHNNTIKKHLVFPATKAVRTLEGGLRLQGKYKMSRSDAPLVSVITVTKNRSDYLHKALLSVLTQSYKNIEYIVIDGLSVDNTPLLLMTYGDALDYYISEEDTGIYEAINKGISVASGDYIIILNDDDWYDTYTIETLIKEALKKPTHIISALARTVNEKGLVAGSIPDFPWSGFVYFRCPLRHELMLIPSYIYDNIGYYDTKYKIISDLKFMQQIYAHKYPICVLQKELMYFSLHGTSQEMPALLEERKILLEENFPFLSAEDNAYLCNMTFKEHDYCYTLLNTYATQVHFVQALTDYLRACTTTFIRI